MRKNLIEITAMCLLLSACAPTMKTLHGPRLDESAFKIDEDSDSQMLPTPELRSDAYKVVASRLTTSFLKCPAKIWPDYSWARMNVVFVENESQSFVWKGSSGTLETIDASKIPAAARASHFDMFELDGMKAVALKLDTSVEDIFSMASHEGFHDHGQDGWSRRSGKRGTDYPVSALPRIYRRMTFERLKEYFVSRGNDTIALRKAAFWFNRWKTEFPNESLTTTDGYEGTARYVEVLSSEVADLGCEASDPELAASLTAKLDDLMGFSVSGERLSLDSEGYDIGGLAALTLRFYSKDNSWFNEMKNAKTPPEILFAGLNPLTDVINEGLQAKFETSAIASNVKIDGWIGKDLPRWKAINSIRVVLDGSSMQGSYSPYGFFNVTAADGLRAIPLARPSTFINAGRTIKAEPGIVFYASDSAPCPGTFIALVEASEVKFENSVATVSATNLNGSAPGKLVTDSAGLNWFCATLK